MLVAWQQASRVACPEEQLVEKQESRQPTLKIKVVRPISINVENLNIEIVHSML